MDNQQVRIAKDLGWLAGIFDGEGHVYINRRKDRYFERKTEKLNLRKYNNWDQYVPMCGIGNANEEIIEELHRIFEEHRIGHWISERGKKDKVKRIEISGIKRVLSFCKLIKGCLVGKRRQIELLHNFLQYHLDNPDYGSGRPQDGNRGMSKERKKMWEDLKKVISYMSHLSIAINLRDFTPFNELSNTDKVDNLNDKVQMQ